MNLAFSKSLDANYEIPIRLTSNLSYFPFELLEANDIDVFVKENELILSFSDSLISNVYFSDVINGEMGLNNVIPKKRKITIEDPLWIKAGFLYTDLKNVSNFTPVVTFTPITSDCKDLFKVNLVVEALIFVSMYSKLSDIYKSVVFNINEKLVNFKMAYSFLSEVMKTHQIRELISLNYRLENDILTVILPSVQFEIEEAWRKEISKSFNLPRTLQRCQSMFPPKDVLIRMTENGDKLVNPHLKIATTFVDSHVVKGRYTYYHYMQDNINDKGWGCAYRSLQTIISWFVWQGWSSISIPSHRDIQISLVKMGDKESSFINSHAWIGSFEINIVLQDLLHNENRIISLNKGSELADIYEDLKHHFNTCGAPVMIGGGQLAHTIIGVSKDDNGKIRFLILDPHYVGSSRDVTTIIGKGWCGWKELSFWKENLPYNLCLPICPRG